MIPRRLHLSILISTTIHGMTLWALSGLEFGKMKGTRISRPVAEEFILIRRYIPPSWITPHVPFSLSKPPIAPPQRVPEIGRPFDFIPFSGGVPDFEKRGHSLSSYKPKLMLAERPEAGGIQIPLVWGSGGYKGFGVPGFGWGRGLSRAASVRRPPSIPKPLHNEAITRASLPPIPIPEISKPEAEQLDIISREYEELASRIREKIERVKSYPEGSREKGEEGKVVLLVFLNGEGRVGEVEISQGCGYPDLEKAAVDAVMKAQPFPIPERLREKGVWISVSISFKLDRI